jgi:hypothetical protein
MPRSGEPNVARQVHVVEELLAARAEHVIEGGQDAQLGHHCVHLRLG